MHVANDGRQNLCYRAPENSEKLVMVLMLEVEKPDMFLWASTLPAGTSMGFSTLRQMEAFRESMAGHEIVKTIFRFRSERLAHQSAPVS